MCDRPESAVSLQGDNSREVVARTREDIRYTRVATGELPRRTLSHAMLSTSFQRERFERVICEMKAGDALVRAKDSGGKSD